MKTALIVLAFVGVAYAGVGTLTDQQEDDVLNSLINPCLNGDIPETGKLINGEWVYCKRAPGTTTQRFERQKNIRIPGARQTVLVQPPTQRFEHNLKVNAHVEGGKTVVYVVPSRPDNKYNVEVTPVTERPEKPTVYFLKKNGAGGQSSGVAAAKRFPRYPEYDDQE